MMSERGTCELKVGLVKQPLNRNGHATSPREVHDKANDDRGRGHGSDVGFVVGGYRVWLGLMVDMYEAIELADRETINIIEKERNEGKLSRPRRIG